MARVPTRRRAGDHGRVGISRCVSPRSSIRFGIELSNDLKRRFNKTESHFISQNDVPGTTVSALPIFRKNGIYAFHILHHAPTSPSPTPGRQRRQPAAERAQHLPVERPGQRGHSPEPEPPQRLRRLAHAGRGVWTLAEP